MKKKPNFIIIGAMKCATSSLHEQLAIQPGIFMSDLKEPNFFSDDHQYAKGEEWYLNHFASAQKGDLCGESSTHYTKLPNYPHTIERLSQYLPDVKLIYVMRHPLDRLVSQYVHECTEKVITVDINQAISQHPELINYSRYSLQLQPYFEVFGKENILPVFFERLCENPLPELERICAFIGYTKQPVWDEELGTRNQSSQRLRKSVWRDFLVEIPVLKSLRQQLIPKDFRNWVRSWWTMKQKPQLTSEQIQKLETIFDEDLEQLGSLLGTELTCNNFKEVVSSQSLQNPHFH